MRRLGAILKRDYFPSLRVLDEELDETERLSLSVFQTRYTTEDNASFAELLERENATRREKYERVFGGPALLVDDPSRRLRLTDSAVDDSKFKRPMRLLSGASAASMAPAINVQNTRFLSARKDVGSPSSLGSLASLTPFREREGDFLPMTPLRPETETPGKFFRVPPTPVREQLAHSLASKRSSGRVSRDARRTPNNTDRRTAYDLDRLKTLTPKRAAANDRNTDAGADRLVARRE